MDEPESNVTTDAEPVPPRSFTGTDVEIEESSETLPKAPFSSIDEQESHQHVTTEDVSENNFPTTLELPYEIQQIKIGDDNQAGNVDVLAADNQAGNVDVLAADNQAGNVDVPAAENQAGNDVNPAGDNHAETVDVPGGKLPFIVIPENWLFNDLKCSLANALTEKDLKVLKTRFSGKSLHYYMYINITCT